MSFKGNHILLGNAISEESLTKAKGLCSSSMHHLLDCWGKDLVASTFTIQDHICVTLLNFRVPYGVGVLFPLRTSMQCCLMLFMVQELC